MRVAVITGSASGLGRALVEEFAGAGYAVAGLDIAPQQPRAGLTSWHVDLTNAEAVHSTFAEIRDRLGAPSVCVTAAGIYPRSTLSSATTEAYRTIFDVNVLGTLLPAQAFASIADATNSSTLITISSVDGLTPYQESILYSASKAAVINLTQGIAAELADHGIRVVGLAPGYLATDRVIAINGRDQLPPDTADPREVAQACVRLADGGGIPLLTGQTVVLRRSALEIRPTRA